MEFVNGQGQDFQDPDSSGDAMTYDAAQTAIAALPVVYSGGVQKLNIKQIATTISTTSGSYVLYMTDNGLIGGNALFPNEILYINLSVNDGTNIYGLGFVVSNSNKTLTITCNRQAFTTGNFLTTLLGGLGQALTGVSLTAAPNGTSVGVHVIGR